MTQGVQAAFVGYNETDSTSVNVLTTSSSDYFATMVPPLTAQGGGGNCGVTFLSPHYAITASHCVDATLDSQSFKYWPDLSSGFDVQTILTNNLNPLYVFAASAVSGTSNESTWHNTNPIPSGVGYNVSVVHCWVYNRCDTEYGPRTCPAIPNQENADVALIYCPWRTSGDYVTVNSTDPPIGANVVVNWFHEVVNLATNASDTTHNAPPSNWSGYGANLPPKSTNYHYGHLSQAQLIPLRSSKWPSGQLYKTLSNYTQTVGTDVPGCHGMSGSSVTLNGTSNVLGNIVIGDGLDGLCHDMANSVPGQLHTEYLKTKYARDLQGVVLGDR